jgi:hypothetical protein
VWLARAKIERCGAGFWKLNYYSCVEVLSSGIKSSRLILYFSWKMLNGNFEQVQLSQKICCHRVKPTGSRKRQQSGGQAWRRLNLFDIFARRQFAAIEVVI